MSQLDLYERYAEWLDEEFDDSLIITYTYTGNVPIFKILYDPSVSKQDLLDKIPQEWKVAESSGKIELTLKEYTANCEEALRTDRILETPYMTDAKNRLLDHLLDYDSAM